MEPIASHREQHFEPLGLWRSILTIRGEQFTELVRNPIPEMTVTRAAPWIVLLITVLPIAAEGEWSYFNNNADIRALHQSGDTLWVGTNGGLIGYDLLGGEIVRRVTAGSLLPDNSVRAITERGRRLYVGTDNGLVVIGAGGNLIYDAAQSPVFGDVRSLSFGVNGDTYIGTFGHGVGVLEEKGRGATKLFRITRDDSLLDNKVFAVAAVGAGRVYFATSLGLCAYRDSAWVSFQAGAGLPRGEVKQLHHVEKDRFYLLIRGHGIYRFNEDRSIRIRPPADFPNPEVAAITLDGTGALWAAGRFGGIARYQGGNWTSYGLDDAAVTETNWRCGYTGPDNTVYFGSADGRLAIITDGVVRLVSLPSTLPSGFIGPMIEVDSGEKLIVNGSHLLLARGSSEPVAVEDGLGSVFALARAPDGAIWASVPTGLLRRAGNRWDPIRPVIDPRPPVFLSLAFDRAGHLWAGAHDGQVYRFDGDFWVPFASDPELESGPIDRLLVDAAQAVWAVGRAGAHRFDGLRWASFGPDTFDGEEIRDAAVGPFGRIVVITDYKIWRYDDARGWYARQSGLGAVGLFRRVDVDSLGRVYVGTSRGLAAIAEEAPMWLDVHGGLKGKDVSSLLIDSENVLWVGFRTDGVMRIPLETLWE
jgi:ligand-binding sensor domain-containing protein